MRNAMIREGEGRREGGRGKKEGREGGCNVTV
jgi:hypothetical protein